MSRLQYFRVPKLLFDGFCASLQGIDQAIWVATLPEADQALLRNFSADVVNNAPGLTEAMEQATQSYQGQQRLLGDIYGNEGAEDDNHLWADVVDGGDLAADAPNGDAACIRL